MQEKRKGFGGDWLGRAMPDYSSCDSAIE